mmetsp:Transcript_11697/g.19046  ORF Transcript_11697/g.19046 Transcript_11697/m.19046 type:complete len:318 (-) Transcript_11697:1912-2865(-)|eukprot:CAMPEP_0203744684 /NCGR_PEP_ID=MMETSP0098-20131031/668_1 /ASSEMBLY_ACC=CAM_ASM_000208 /TAXON_ID=96639 /ORGANISM=" , Strain NY0313808BC1" /LENGTH=317 /DNA_ID=CAMNT_0050632263 /DNA_START=249 /DNA_END=1202 /DNA_ORIENTATION=+
MADVNLTKRRRVGEYTGENPCRGFVIPRHLLLAIIKPVQPQPHGVERGKIVVKGLSCNGAFSNAHSRLCDSCTKTKSTYDRYMRTVVNTCKNTLGTTLPQMVLMEKAQILHKCAQRIHSLEKQLAAEKKRCDNIQKETFPPLSMILRNLELNNLLPETCFFYKFLFVSLNYWKRMAEKGVRGWQWDRIQFGTEVLAFFMELRKGQGGRRVINYLVNGCNPIKKGKFKSKEQEAVFDPHLYRLPIPPNPTLEYKILADKKKTDLDEAQGMGVPQQQQQMPPHMQQHHLQQMQMQQQRMQPGPPQHHQSMHFQQNQRLV